MGRPKADQEELASCGVRLSPAEIAAVDALAQARGMSRSQVLRKMVQRVLAAEEARTSRTQVTTRFKK